MLHVFEKVFGGRLIAAAGSAYSKDIDLSNKEFDWKFGYAGTVTGEGTVTLTYLTSVDGVTFSAVTSHKSVVATQVKTSGYASNGKIIGEFAELPISCRFLRLLATETVQSNTVTLSLDIIVR